MFFHIFSTHSWIFLWIAVNMLPMDVLKPIEISSIVFVLLNNGERFAVFSSGEITMLATAAKLVGFSFS